MQHEIADLLLSVESATTTTQNLSILLKSKYESDNTRSIRLP